MCFYDECDWYAQIVEDTVGVATKPTKCDECQRIILEGGWVRHIYMQQEEICRNNPQSDDYLGEESDSEDCPEGCEHDYGETFDYDRCKACDQLIEAIHQHELAEGCSEYESRPMLTELYDALDYNGKDYLAKAEALYPGIMKRLSEPFLKVLTRGAR